MSRWAALTLVAFAAAKSTKAAEIKAMEHDIQQIYPASFTNVIGGAQALTVSSVLYFKGSSADDGAFLDTYNEVAKKTKLMLKVTAMDCEADAKSKAHCDRVGVTDTPHLHIYPQSPQPAFKYNGELKAESILSLLYRMIPSHKVNTMTTIEEVNTFKKKSPTLPKILLLSTKKNAPTILKGLSTDSVFVRTIEFGFLGEGKEALIKELNPGNKKKLPAVMMINKGKTTWYSGELNYVSLHEWINVNSESGMGDTVKSADGSQETQAEEPEFEKVREIHAKSQHELCFKQKNVCAIYLSNGPIEDKTADMINSFESTFAPKTDRGIKFNWMWMDISQEAEFKQTLDEMEAKQAEKEERDVEAVTYPTMIFVKPPKKKREERLLSYVKMSAGATVSQSTVGDLIETIAGGTTYLRADLPKFTVRAKKDSKAKREEL